MDGFSSYPKERLRLQRNGKEDILFFVSQDLCTSRATVFLRKRASQFRWIRNAWCRPEPMPSINDAPQGRYFILRLTGFMYFTRNSLSAQKSKPIPLDSKCVVQTGTHAKYQRCPPYLHVYVKSLNRDFYFAAYSYGKFFNDVQIFCEKCEWGFLRGDPNVDIPAWEEAFKAACAGKMPSPSPSLSLSSSSSTSSLSSSSSSSSTTNTVTVTTLQQQPQQLQRPLLTQTTATPQPIAYLLTPTVNNNNNNSTTTTQTPMMVMNSSSGTPTILFASSSASSSLTTTNTSSSSSTPQFVILSANSQSGQQQPTMFFMPTTTSSSSSSITVSPSSSSFTTTTTTSSTRSDEMRIQMETEARLQKQLQSLRQQQQLQQQQQQQQQSVYPSFSSTSSSFVYPTSGSSASIPNEALVRLELQNRAMMEDRHKKEEMEIRIRTEVEKRLREEEERRVLDAIRSGGGGSYQSSYSNTQQQQRRW
eukprot:TRINITY_DN3339_c0_g1_i1.p1 TRINITY_DN3339_c0_g1~~TRINITY_DN3339_c0_g1_i1.p1  ORF type:complete len:476 (+),score=175.94 TRINITY_DN3339_c0_g1_i1:168-1595(+)